VSAAVLFLDNEWRPLRIEIWQRAITDLFLGKVEVVEYSRDRTIRGVGVDHPMPAVVRVVRRFRRDRMRLKFSRLNVYARDRFACQYCGARKPTEELNYDHVVPRSRGGKTTWENIVTACIDCNGAKANRTPDEAGMRLRTKPKKPTYLPAVTVRGMGGRDIPPEWQPYWSTELDP
jgi:5-methylcytosine-specific restriction endonuclease McrA